MQSSQDYERGHAMSSTLRKDICEITAIATHDKDTKEPLC